MRLTIIELEDDGNKSKTTYTNSSITSMVSNKTDSATQTIAPDKITSEIGSSKREIDKAQIKDTVEGSYEKIDPSGVTLEGKTNKYRRGSDRASGIGYAACDPHDEIHNRMLKDNHPYHARDDANHQSR